MDKLQGTSETREPSQQASPRHHRCRNRPCRSVGSVDTRRNGLQRVELLYPGLSTPRDSIAAQGGINAAKNYQNDGDSVYRLFYDTVKGGDFRSREANVYRLAEVSNNIIDQCVAQGVPFAREYGGLLANRSFGGAQVSRTFYAKGQTGQQLLLGAYSSLNRQINKGTVKSYVRREMLDLVVVDGRARGIIVRNLITGEIERYAAHAVVVATGGYGRVFFLRPTLWVATVLLQCSATSTVHTCQTSASRRFTRHVFQSTARTSRNYPYVRVVA